MTNLYELLKKMITRIKKNESDISNRIRSWVVDVPVDTWTSGSYSWGDMSATKSLRIDVPTMKESVHIDVISFISGDHAEACKWKWLNTHDGYINLYGDQEIKGTFKLKLDSFGDVSDG